MKWRKRANSRLNMGAFCRLSSGGIAKSAPSRRPNRSTCADRAALARPGSSRSKRRPLQAQSLPKAAIGLVRYRRPYPPKVTWWWTMMTLGCTVQGCVAEILTIFSLKSAPQSRVASMTLPGTNLTSLRSQSISVNKMPKENSIVRH